ncbi:MAG: MarR family transcriptional regulator [Sciscionella sp.]|nr:MarR family transcriptional regulator [Sciscionella sp.]
MKLPVEQRLGMDIKRVEQELMAAKHAAVKIAGLTVPQYAALLVLSDSPGISAAALARSCLVSAQAMNVVLKNLEERGLVERTPHRWHRNIRQARLTSAGRKALTVADRRAAAIERRIYDEFSPTERDQLRALLARCSTAIAGE